MASLKTPTANFHPLLREHEADFEEMLSCVKLFFDGDAGDFLDEDEVLGFLDRDLSNRLRHGLYETRSAGRIHVIGDSSQVMVVPDLAFAQICKDTGCSINTCTCHQDKKDTKPSVKKH